MRGIILFVLTINLFFAASNPIIFIHGQKGGKDGDVFVIGDITVKENVNLTILPGANIYFCYPDDQYWGLDHSQCELIVKGSLNATGDTQDSIRLSAYPPYGGSPSWYGIRIIEQGDADLAYARIKNSTFAVFLNNATGKIENCKIDSNYYGFYLFNCNATIKNSEIMMNFGMGINCFASQAIIDSNLIYKNSLTEDTLTWLPGNQDIRGSGNKKSQTGFKIPVPKFNALDNTSFGGLRDSLPFPSTGMIISSSNIEITNNRIIDNFKGIYTGGWLVGKINNNIFDSNEFHGFDFVGDSFDIEICNNTFLNNGWFPWPITELAAIYQGIFRYRPKIRIEIKNNRFYNNNVGIYFARYYTAFSSPTQVYVTNNIMRNNKIGIGTRNDRDANLEAICTYNTIVDNQDYQVFHEYSLSQVLNLGNLDNESEIDNGNNKIYDRTGSALYALRNNTEYGIMAQGNNWACSDSTTIDTLLIYDDDENPACGVVNFNYFAIWGDIPPGTVWEGIVNIGGDVVLPEDVTLIIEPGTEVRFAAGIDGAQSGIDTTRSEFIVYGEIVTGGRERVSGNQVKNNNNRTSAVNPNMSNITGDVMTASRPLIKKAGQSIHNYTECDSRIYFTSDAYEPEPGDWYGIRFVNGLEREIDNWVIKYAIRCLDMPMTEELELKDSKIIGASQIGLHFGGEELEMKSCSLLTNYIGAKINTDEFEIKESWFIDNNVGLMLENGKGELKNNLIFGNDTGLVIKTIDGEIKENSLRQNNIGIYVTDGADDLEISKDNEFDHNLLYHIYNNTAEDIDATENYWYPSEPESIAFYIYDYYDDPNLGVVNFDNRPSEDGRYGPQGNDAQLEAINISFGSNPTRHLAVNYSLLTRQEVEISIYDVTGRLVSKEDGMKEVGQHKFMLSDLASGVYFVRFKAPAFKTERKIVLLK